MDLSVLDRVARMQHQCHLMQQTIATLQTQMEDLETSLREQAKTEGKLLSFADLEGVWEDFDLSLEEIKTTEYRLPENLS
jgi:hypothetical protein